VFTDDEIEDAMQGEIARIETTAELCKGAEPVTRQSTYESAESFQSKEINQLDTKIICPILEICAMHNSASYYSVILRLLYFLMKVGTLL
jgi:hypothetical protein